MPTGVLGTGSSALLAFQRALATVSHNVANSATPGYSRQRVELEARPGPPSAISIGQGVDVSNLRRLADGLVFARMNDSSSEVGRLQQLSSLSSRVDALMSDSATSVIAPWSEFFNANKGVVADPSSITARNQTLASGEQLALRFRTLDSKLANLDNDVDQSLSSKISDVNRLASEIAEINRNIVAAGNNASPDLLDSRETRVNQLANLVGAETVLQDSGAMSVFTPGGQPLVMDARASKLTASVDPYRPDRLQLALETPSGTLRLPQSTVSGELGGLLEFRGRVLDPMRAELGRMATVFAKTYNATQNAGIDYNGNPGADMFNIADPTVAGHSGNTGTATLAATVTDTGALTGNNLLLEFDGTNWSATRADTGATVSMTGTGTVADPLVADGVSITVGAGAAAGDRFLLTPTAGTANSLQVALNDPASIAAAAPLVTSPDAGNLGNAAVTGSSITNAATYAGFTSSTIDFIDANNYTLDGVGPFAYTPGAAIAGSGWSLTIEGVPAAGDSFTLTPTQPHSSDNGNARVLSTFDGKDILNGGTMSLNTGVTNLASRSGNEARHSQMSLEAQQAIDDQVKAERESVSGVNLDEEAADMMRYQQAYQAAAQIISTADTMFQALLAAARR